MTFFKKCFALLLLVSCAQVFAQFLPDNTNLNVQSVKRWMDSNRDLASVMQVLDGMNTSDADLKKFDAMPATEQDQKITEFLQKHNLLQQTNSLVARHGWKSAGEYMRLSTRLGNAIAAYFYTQQIANLTEEQKKSVRAKTDAAVLNAPAADIAFIKANESLLKAYIQAYSNGR